MTVRFQSHGGELKSKPPVGATLAAPPAGADLSVDAAADFGYFFPPSGNASDYLAEGAATISQLDRLGELMIEQGTPDAKEANSTLPPVLTYWGQFLDHELTARTDRDSEITDIRDPTPADPSAVEQNLKNARTPRFDLDSVYGGVPVGTGVGKDAATVISGMRHPTFTNKMRVGTSPSGTDLPDSLDANRDLPRYVQVQASVREAAKRLAKDSLSDADFAKFIENLPKRALIGDQRNDENLIIAQFHLSFLRFHNKAVDYLDNHNTGWIADFGSAQLLTKLHYQWLIVHGYLKAICKAGVLQSVIADRASHFFTFRAEYDARQPQARLGNAIPLEFSAAAYRFGHSMVRASYDHNRIFGRGGTIIPEAPFNLLFTFTGGGGLGDNDRLPRNWIIDWTRFLGLTPPDDLEPARVARKIDTELAPPLGDLSKEGNDEPEGSPLQLLFKQLARRNLRRGYNLKLPTGQALHGYLKSIGAVSSDPIADVSTLFGGKQELQTHLIDSGFHSSTPLWFYLLAEAEQGGGNSLGEVGSWLVASTFVGVLLSDPDSALSIGFDPAHSPIKMPNGSAIDSIAKWMKFAVVMP